MGCNNKISSTCGKKINAKCVDYEGEFHTDSELAACDCPNMEDVIEDINNTLNNIKTNLDTSGLGNSCIDYDEQGGEITISEALLKLEEKLCEVADYVNFSEPEACPPIYTQDITCLNLDFACLTDPCGEQITDLKTLLQALITQACA
jgi:hypothetical protein